MNLRAIAAQSVAEVLDKHRSLSDVLPEFKKKCKNAEDQALLQAITFGVLRFYPRLKFIADQLLKKPFKAKESVLLYLILVGIYQLNDLRIPDYAALSETVEAARHLKMPWAAALVNATLREFQRHSQGLLAKAQKNKQIWYSHPEWLYNTIQAAWPSHWESILEANNTAAPLTLRVNQQACSTTDYLTQLANHHISATPISSIPTALRLETPCDITQLPGYTEGLFSVQDGASQSAALLLELHPNLNILDACAAPGGKACHILEQMPSSTLLAVDIAKERTDKIRENLKRLKLKAEVLTADVNTVPSIFKEPHFDRILLDAPCSATGVIRRHPDIKYLRRAEDIAVLSEQQLKLLQTLWPLLKPGGLLLYATCSILPEENEYVIKKFLDQQKDAVLSSIQLGFGIPMEVGIQILPGQNDMDGFYYARIGKKC